MRVAILNDTDDAGTHFGCSRVMECIRSNLVNRGFMIETTIPAATNWSKSDDHVTQLKRCDLILVNGEGTLHHGRPKGRWLLDVAADPRFSRSAKVLVNALWQENPDSWGELVRGFDLVQARYSNSARELSKIREDRTPWFGDMSLYKASIPTDQPRKGFFIGDSVSSSASVLLSALARKMSGVESGVRLVPVVSEKFGRTTHKKISGKIKKLIGEARLKRALQGTITPEYMDCESDYLDQLSRSSLSVTGRFHSVCISLVTKTPFLALASNSHKIEALVSDVGLNPSRVVARSELNVHHVLNRDWSYSKTELANIEKFLSCTRNSVEELFGNISKLTQLRQGN